MSQQCVSAVPQVIDALYALAVANLPAGVSVYDGDAGASDDPGSFLMIGVEDPDSQSMSMAASSDQDWANAHYGPRDESGVITCAAVAWNGDMDQKQARDGAYAMAAALSKVIGNDPTLGIGDWVRGTGITRGELQQFTGTDEDGEPAGVSALLVFHIGFDARIYPPA